MAIHALYALYAAAAGRETNGRPLGQPRIIAQTDLRCGGIGWGDDDLAILFEVCLGGVSM